jgi:hypothetical protein
LDYAPKGIHRDKKKYGFQGTPSCASISAMEGYTKSRRDEVESLGFTLMYLIDKKAITWGELTKVPEIIPLKREFLVAETIPDQFFYIREFIRIT